jgi:glycosyltransferase involved in cell wall biosynthesis
LVFVLPRTSPRPIGALKVIYEHADQLAARRHRVTLVHPCQTGQAEGPGADPHPWFEFRSKGVRSLVVPDLAGHSIPGHFDLVVGTAWQTVAAVQALPPRFGRKTYFLQDHESYLLGDEAIRAAMTRTFAVPWPLIVNSEPVQHLVETVAGRHCHRIPCVVDTAAFGLDIPIDSGARQLIGFAARTEQAKRTSDAITALQLVRSHLPVGRRPGAWCFGAYPRAGLPSWITHYPAPSDSELRQLYNRTAVFVVPSLHEGFGLPGAEAMACGAALVSTRNGGVNAYATHAKSAWLCPAGDPQALASATNKLVSDASLRHRIARAGATDVGCQKPGDAADALEAVLNDIVNSDGTPLTGGSVDCH